MHVEKKTHTIILTPDAIELEVKYELKNTLIYPAYQYSISFLSYSVGQIFNVRNYVKTYE